MLPKIKKFTFNLLRRDLSPMGQRPYRFGTFSAKVHNLSIWKIEHPPAGAARGIAVIYFFVVEKVARVKKAYTGDHLAPH